MSAIKCSIQINVNCPLPIRRGDLLHPTRRSGDAGVVHENIQAAKSRTYVLKHPLNFRFGTHVGPADAQGGDVALALGDQLFIDIADVHPRVTGGEALGYHPSNPRSARRHQHPEPRFDLLVEHESSSPFVTQVLNTVRNGVAKPGSAVQQLPPSPGCSSGNFSYGPEPVII